MVGETPVPLPQRMGSTIVTLSIGMTVANSPAGDMRQVEELIGLADRALLGAKTQGRNLVTVARSAA